MNKDQVLELIKALRSGEYVQCKNTLKINNSFCIMGVAADVYMKNNPNSKLKWESPDFLPRVEYLVDYTRELPVKWVSRVPISVCNWYGFKSFMEETLIDLNDSVLNHCSFNKIADILEEWLKVSP